MNQFTEFQDATLRDADTLELLAWIIRKRKRFRVTGQSMMPFLVPGEEVLIDPNAYTSRSPEPGDIVVAEHPNFQGFCLVKRVVAVLDSGDCIVMGDNTSESTDSRNFGAVPPQKILGKVTSRFAR